jgi:hypothetical protein
MNFWKALRWAAALVFLVIVLSAWLACERHPSGGGNGTAEPPPAPIFR